MPNLVSSAKNPPWQQILHIKALVAFIQQNITFVHLQKTDYD